MVVPGAHQLLVEHAERMVLTWNSAVHKELLAAGEQYVCTASILWGVLVNAGSPHADQVPDDGELTYAVTPDDVVTFVGHCASQFLHTQPRT
jgi:hypothetical protein